MDRTERIKGLFDDIMDIERAILGDDDYYELVDRYTMMREQKTDKQKETEVYNWEERT